MMAAQPTQADLPPPPDAGIDTTIIDCAATLAAETLGGIAAKEANEEDACEDGGIDTTYLQGLVEEVKEIVLCDEESDCRYLPNEEVDCPNSDFAIVAIQDGEASVAVIECLNTYGLGSFEEIEECLQINMAATGGVSDLCDVEDPGTGIPEPIACSAMGRYLELQPAAGDDECDTLDPPSGSANAFFADNGGHVCTGHSREVASAGGSYEFGANVFVVAKVTLSTQMTAATAFTFACDFTQVGGGFGSGGLFRKCHLQAWNGGAWVDIQAPIPYDGVDATSCTYPVQPWHSESFSGAGTAYGPWAKLPTQTTVAPSSSSPYQALRLANLPVLPLDGPAYGMDNWAPQDFGIHYQ